MSKQSRITFSLDPNVNLFLTRVFSIYIQFCSSSLPGYRLSRPPTWEFAKLLLVPSSEDCCSAAVLQCQSGGGIAAVRRVKWAEPESPGKWRHTSWPLGVNTIPDTTRTTSTRSRPSWVIRIIIRIIIRNIIRIPEDTSQETNRESRPDRPGSRWGWDTANYRTILRGFTFQSVYNPLFFCIFPWSNVNTEKVTREND